MSSSCSFCLYLKHILFNYIFRLLILQWGLGLTLKHRKNVSNMKSPHEAVMVTWCTFVLFILVKWPWPHFMVLVASWSKTKSCYPFPIRWFLFTDILFTSGKENKSLMWSLFVQLQLGRTSSYQQPKIQPSWTARQRSSTMSTWVWMSASLSSRGVRPRDSHRKILHRYCRERPCSVWEGGLFMDVKCMFPVYEQWSLLHGRDGIAWSKSKVVGCCCCCCYPSIPVFFFFGQFLSVSPPPQTGADFSINYVCLHSRSFLVWYDFGAHLFLFSASFPVPQHKYTP